MSEFERDKIALLPDSPEFLEQAHAAVVAMADQLDSGMELKAVIVEAVSQQIFPEIFNRTMCDVLWSEIRGFFDSFRAARETFGKVARAKAGDARVNSLVINLTEDFIAQIRPYLEAMRNLQTGDIGAHLKVAAAMMSPSNFLGKPSDGELAERLLRELSVAQACQRNLRDDTGGGNSTAWAINHMAMPDKNGIGAKAEGAASELARIIVKAEGLPTTERGELALEILQLMSVEEVTARLAKAGLIENPGLAGPTEVKRLPESVAVRTRALLAAEPEGEET